MRSSVLFRLLLSVLFYKLTLSKDNKIRKCDYSSMCLDLLNEVQIEIFFHVPPKTIDHGELTLSANNSFKYISKPKITKQNTVIFKFTPEYIGTYAFHFNHNLKCPMNKMIIVKRPFTLKQMPKLYFVSDESKKIGFSFPIYFTFDYEIELHKDKGDIRGISYGETGTGEEMITKSLNCKIDGFNNKTIACSGKEMKVTSDAIGYYYYDKCYLQHTLGFVSVITTSIEFMPLSSSGNPSLLAKLQPHYLKQYQADKIILITFVISTEKKRDLEYLYYIASPIANKYSSEFVVTYAEWERDTYLTSHFDLKNDGNVKIVVYDFSTDNVYIGNVSSSEQVEGIVEALSKNELEWTSQNAFRWLISKIGIKLKREKEQSYYFLFCCFCFVFLVVLRCYLINKKRPKEQSASFAYNTKKTE